MLWHIRAFVAGGDSAEDTRLRVRGGEAAGDLSYSLCGPFMYPCIAQDLRAGGPARLALGLGEAGHCRRRRGAGTPCPRPGPAAAVDGGARSGRGDGACNWQCQWRAHARGPMGRHWHGPSQGEPAAKSGEPRAASR